MVYVKPGEEVQKLNYGSKAIGVVFLRFQTEKEMWNVLNKISDSIEVEVEPA